MNKTIQVTIKLETIQNRPHKSICTYKIILNYKIWRSEPEFIKWLKFSFWNDSIAYKGSIG